MSESDLAIQFELKERINYPQILASALLTLKKANAQPEFQPSRIRNIIMDLFTDIPDTWYDDKFRKDIKNCLLEKRIDIRPEFAGIKKSLKQCLEDNTPTFKTIKEINFFRLKRAIINLLDRRAMLVRREKIELSTGENLEYVTLEDLEADFDWESEEPPNDLKVENNA